MKLALLLILISICRLVNCQEMIYVSPDGNDQSLGSLANPLNTLSAALKKAGASSNPSVQIVMRGGNYYLKKPVLINNQVLKQRKLVISSYKNEQPILHGALPLKPIWKPWGKNGWKATIGKGKKLDQLFCNGQVLAMARFPNIDSTARFFYGSSATALDKNRIRKWKKPSGGYIHALHQAEWGGFHYQILKTYGEDSLVLEGGWQNNRSAPIHSEHRFVENIFEELDSPGEWFYDKTSGVLYLNPPVSIHPDKATFTFSNLNDLIHIIGSASSPVNSITIDGIQFTGTNRTFMLTKEPLLRSDWTIYRGGAILMEGTENIIIKNCHFYNLGGNALFLSGYNFNNTIQSNHIHHIGANAITLVGNARAVRSPLSNYNETQAYENMDLQPGPKTADYPSKCLVFDNLIHEIGKIEKQVAGVEISMSMDITVSHNTIYKVPRAGINIGDGCWGGHVIEFNDVFHTVLETGDHGAFNSWGRDRFWLPSIEAVDQLVAMDTILPYLDVIKPITLRNNRFHCEHGWDIDLDDGSSNYHIYNNICLNGGLKLREGFGRVVKNNIVINNSFHPHVWYINSQDVFTKNIVSGPYAPIRIRKWGKEVDHNFFIQTGGLEDARKNGTDSNSVQGDPLFNNAAKGDFKLLSNSPVYRTGFIPFEMDSIGVVSTKLLELAEKAPVPQLIITNIQKNGVIQEWLGAKIKDIETLGEQSASGAPDKNGVLILSVPEGSNAAKNKLIAGDIILSVNGKPVINTSGLLSIYQSHLWKGTVTITILHQQVIKEVQLQL